MHAQAIRPYLPREAAARGLLEVLQRRRLRKTPTDSMWQKREGGEDQGNVWGGGGGGGGGANETIYVCVVGTKELIHVCGWVVWGSGTKELIHVCGWVV